MSLLHIFLLIYLLRICFSCWLYWRQVTINWKEKRMIDSIIYIFLPQKGVLNGCVRWQKREWRMEHWIQMYGASFEKIPFFSIMRSISVKYLFISFEWIWPMSTHMEQTILSNGFSFQTVIRLKRARIHPESRCGCRCEYNSKSMRSFFWNSLNHKTSFSMSTIFKLAHPSKNLVHPCIDFIWISTDTQYSAKMGSKANQHEISISIAMLVVVYHFDSSKTYSYVTLFQFFLSFQNDWHLFLHHLLGGTHIKLFLSPCRFYHCRINHIHQKGRMRCLCQIIRNNSGLNYTKWNKWFLFES